MSRQCDAAHGGGDQGGAGCRTPDTRVLQAQGWLPHYLQSESRSLSSKLVLNYAIIELKNRICEKNWRRTRYMGMRQCRAKST